MDIPIGAQEHATRATSHRQIGDALARASSEWAAVAYFYSAYHLARDAIRNDPVFDDPTRLSRLNSELTMPDRDTSRHKARRRQGQDREWGLNELVGLLYGPPAARPYDKLFQASLFVRYGTGIPRGLTVTELSDRLRELETLSLNGQLRAA